MEFRPTFINGTQLEFIDISSEEFREYVFSASNGAPIRVIIDQPYLLHVNECGGHRIFDLRGECHYIQAGWIHLKCKSKPGQPHFIS